MPSKKKPPTLPEKLRNLADEIEGILKPRRPMTPEELTASVLADLRKRSFKVRLLARRKAKASKQAEEETDGGSGDDGAPTAPPQPSRPRPRR